MNASMRLALAAGFSAFLLTPLAQAASPGNESAEQNVRESQQYDRAVCSNPAFRAKRMAQECGPITDPQLHESCVATFDCGKGVAAPNWRKAPASERIR
jgi:hypothetical protein